jgi:hypothetical protein
MRKHYYLIFFLSLFFSCFAQEEDKKREDNHFNFFSIGVSNPVGSFASKNPNSEQTPGYATLGPVIDFTYFVPVYKNYGYLIAVNMHGINTNHHNLVKDIAQPYTDDFTVINTYWEFERPFFHFGVFARYPLTNKLSIEPQFLFSFVQYLSPGFEAYNINSPSGYPSLINRESVVSKYTRSMIFRFAFNYSLNDKWYLVSNIDYSTSNPRFENRTTRTNLGSYTENFTQKIRLVNFSLGIGFFIKSKD